MRQVPERLLRTEEVADWLGVSPASIYSAACRGGALDIPRIKIGPLVRYRPSDVEKWLERQAGGENDA